MQKKVHKVRVKGDKVQKENLTPLRTRLKKLEGQLRQTSSDIASTAQSVDRARQNLSAVRDLVESRNKPAEAVNLETLSQETRGTIDPVRTGLTAIDDDSGAVEKDMDDLARDLAALTATEPVCKNCRRIWPPLTNPPAIWTKFSTGTSA